MQYNTLGTTDIKVSKICLGTMTWGEQNTQQDAFDQLDYALDHEINFIDTAELYAIPPKEDTYGVTETIIGHWLKQSGKRSNIILASKIAGPGLPWIREGKGFVIEEIEQAVDASLKRLQTDTIDLMQLHWPQRKVPLWGKMNHHPNMIQEGDLDHLTQYYQAITKIAQKGKFRTIGLSNETAWGVMKYQQLAETLSLPPMVSIQNAYSLVRREFEVALSEVALHEKVGLLAYSPLAGGLLSGKYAAGNMPEGSRFKLFPETMGYYKNERSEEAIVTYQALADELGMTLTQLSLAFVNDQAFVTSNIIGATTMAQLKENIQSADITLSEETRQKIDDIFTQYPNPGNW